VRVVLASGNAGKLRELAPLLKPAGFEFAWQAELGIASPPETGTTFLANALIKARHAAAGAALAAIADDSGIEVDVLDGAPGAYSERYAGEHASDEENLIKLLAALRDVPEESRSARYRCVIVFVSHAADPAPVIAEGVWEGRIAQTPRGAGGFGYDPIFVPEGFSCTAAQLDADLKNALSHRGKALQNLLRAITARARHSC